MPSLPFKKGCLGTLATPISFHASVHHRPLGGIAIRRVAAMSLVVLSPDVGFASDEKGLQLGDRLYSRGEVPLTLGGRRGGVAKGKVRGLVPARAAQFPNMFELRGSKFAVCIQKRPLNTETLFLQRPSVFSGA